MTRFPAQMDLRAAQTPHFLLKDVRFRTDLKSVMPASVVLQVSNADKFVAERLPCVLRLPNRKGCR
jgi:hypothetical protein